MTLRQPITLFEIDKPRCSRTYGVAPCAAVLGTTGDDKCFNSRKSCQDPANLDLSETVTLRFSEPQEGVEQYGPVIPSITSITTMPLTVNLGGMESSVAPLGDRESVTIKVKDHPYSDLLTDKYRLERETGAAQVSAGEVDFPFADTASIVARHGSELAAITFTRAGATATRVNASGLIETVAADTPRFDYDPVTLECKGLLIEEARTNVCLQSNDFTNAGVWNCGNCTVTPNADTSGLLPLSKITVTATAWASVVQPFGSTLAANTVYTLSRYCKQGNTPELQFGLYDDTAVEWIALVHFDWATKTADLRNSKVAGAAVGQENCGNGIYRVWVTFDSGPNAATDSLATYNYIRNGGDEQAGDYDYRGGEQLEPGAFPTSYIPTTAAAVTRNADVAMIGDISGFFNANGGTILCEASRPSIVTNGAFPGPLLFDDGATVDNRIGIVQNNSTNVIAYSRSGGVQSVTPALGTIAVDAAFRVALAYANADFAASMDGGASG